jgi:hypothetical protein
MASLQGICYLLQRREVKKGISGKGRNEGGKVTWDFEERVGIVSEMVLERRDSIWRGGWGDTDGCGCRGGSL